MSGQGGYYKFRCKNWLTYNCPNWVWINGYSCANCTAQGRSIGVINTSDSSRIAREVSVPLFDNGTLRYTMMEIIVGDRIGGGWQLKDEPIQPFPGPMLEPLGGDSSSGWGGGTGRPRGGKAIHDDEQLPLPWADDGDNGD